MKRSQTMQTVNRLPIWRALLAAVAAVAVSSALCAPAQASEFGLVPESLSTELSTLQAGAHPDLRVRFSFKRNADNVSPAGGAVKSYQINLPKGLIGNPTSIPTCPLVDAIKGGRQCPRETMVGSATVTPFLGFPFANHVSIYNVNPYPGEPAAFAFRVIYPIRIDTFIRRDGDYGVSVTGENLTEAAALLGADITFWGIPADHSGPGPEFDQSNNGGTATIGGPNPDAERIPLMTNPTECSGKALTSSMVAHPWLHSEETATGEYSIGKITGCNQLAFTPTVEAKPTTNLAEAPTGLDFNLHMPQHNKFVGVNELQTVSVHANAGQFRLSYGGETTGDLPYNAGQLNLTETFPIVGPNLPVQEALEALPSIGAGNVSVFGGFYNSSGFGYVEGPIVIMFKGDLANTDVEQLSAENGSEPLSFSANGKTNPGSVTVATSRPGAAAGSVSEESATAQLRDAVVTLPEGMTVNPPSADGLESCSLAQLGMSASGQPNGSPVTCPDASKLGTVKAVSPALDHPLAGTVYLAAQNENPFGSLLAIYLVIDDPLSGTLIKLAGQVEPDPTTGQITVSFKQNPQLPVEDLDLSFFSGPRAALKTPSACGKQTIEITLTPWSSPDAPDAELQSPFNLTNGPDGGACPAQGASAPNTPAFSAGTLSPTAKAFSPFVLKLARADGSQQLKSIDTTLPKGLLAKLAGVSSCSDAALAVAAANSGKAEQASPSCPANSQLGTVDVAAGAGSTPLHVPGKVYLAGPYKGAFASIAIVTPAVAGPFDLGTVVTRAALEVDSASAQVKAVSDPIPSILQGIPLDLRSIAVSLDRPNFTINPTNCDATAVLGAATSVFNQVASLSDHFQTNDCPTLGFKPSLALSLKGPVNRRAHPSLTASLTARPGDANIAAAQVKLPKAAFLDNAHIGEVCTRVQFAAHQCPAGSVYGTATATTPLLDYPLSGNVYLRSSSNKLPDLVVGFQGPSSQPIEVELAGKTDSVKGALRNTFEAVPDVPVSKFSLNLFGGKKGLIIMSSGFCAHPRAEVNFDAQNGDSVSSAPKVAAKKCSKPKRNVRSLHKEESK